MRNIDRRMDNLFRADDTACQRLFNTRHLLTLMRVSRGRGFTFTRHGLCRSPVCLRTAGFVTTVCSALPDGCSYGRFFTTTNLFPGLQTTRLFRMRLGIFLQRSYTHSCRLLLPFYPLPRRTICCSPAPYVRHHYTLRNLPYPVHGWLFSASDCSCLNCDWTLRWEHNLTFRHSQFSDSRTIFQLYLSVGDTFSDFHCCITALLQRDLYVIIPIDLISKPYSMMGTDGVG